MDLLDVRPDAEVAMYVRNTQAALELSASNVSPMVLEYLCDGKIEFESESPLPMKASFNALIDRLITLLHISPPVTKPPHGDDCCCAQAKGWRTDGRRIASCQRQDVEHLLSLPSFEQHMRSLLLAPAPHRMLHQQGVASVAIATVPSCLVPHIVGVRMKGGVTVPWCSQPVRFMALVIGPADPQALHPESGFAHRALLGVASQLLGFLSNESVTPRFFAATSRTDVRAIVSEWRGAVILSRRSSSMDLRRSSASISALRQSMADGLSPLSSKRRSEMSPAEVTEHHESLVGSSLRQELRWTVAAWPTDWKWESASSLMYSASYMFVATFVPAIAFGGYLQTVTADKMGLTEVLLAQSLPSLLYSLVGGNPLAVLRVSGPVVAFVGIAAKTADSFGHEVLPLWSLTTLWMALFLFVAAVAHWSRFITRVTDFTEEVFSALVSIIFITTAVEFVSSYFAPSASPAQDTIAIFTLLLFLLSYVISTFGNAFRTSRFLSSRVRNAAFVMSGVVAIAVPAALSAWTRGRLHDSETLAPLAHLDTNRDGAWLSPTMERPWLVPLAPSLENDPMIIATSAVLGLCLALLFYLEQNVSILLMNTPDHQLTRPPSFHADLAITATFSAVCGLLGLPVSHIALPHSVLHVVAAGQSFEDIVDGQVRRTTLSVNETRWSALVTALLMLGGTFIAHLFDFIPLAALYGAFLYLGVSSLASNALVARITLPFTSSYPASSVAHLLPLSHINLYSFIQLLWLAAIFAVKKISSVSPLFPLLVFAMVPFREKVLPKMLKEFELDLLEHSHESTQDDRRHRRRI